MRFGFLEWLKSVAALALVGVLACAGIFLEGSALGALKGKRTFYLHSASSWASQKCVLQVVDLPFVTGESVEVLLTEADGFVESALERYGAAVQFVEEVDGVTSYYCYSPYLARKVFLQGRAVNLHIAVRESDGAAVVGTPIIFGGF